MKEWRRRTDFFSLSAPETIMDFEKQKLLLVLVVLASALEVAESGFNAVYLKQTAANFTCGNPPEEFFETQQGFLDDVDRIPYICNASDPVKAYPPENMVDGLLATHWQSRADEDLAYITISFGQAFFAQHISITFGNYRRPGAIKVEKSTDFGATFAPWHYLVTPPASRQCREQFGVEAQGVISRVDQVLCTEYSEYVPREFNETISIQLNQNQRGDGTPDPYTPGLQAWMNATAVRFSFSGLFRKFDRMSIKWHHYTVREIEVTSRCNCNGHANGTHCPLNQSTSLRTCQCEGNTCGAHCDECCPLYNQFPWKIGNGAPWINDPAAKCEPCNCHNHADTCLYNQTVNDQGLSMSVNGSMIGGGVCLDCQHNTQGVNCERCRDFFYRPSENNQTDSDACKACNCNTNGTANVSSLSFGDCVRDENELPTHPGKQPGDCYCKEFVRGRQCDTCKAGYYRMTQGNPQGCIACNCHLNGAVNRSDVCDGDYHGQCNCKSNVDFRDCSQCKDGYYDLQDSDANGCKACDCDVGGSSSGQTCDKVTGVCHCRSNVIGNSCNRTASGFYYPDSHFIQAIGSPYKPSTDALYVLLDIPKTGNYSLLVRYTNLGLEAHTQVAVQFKNTSVSGQQAGDLFIFSPSLQECVNCPETINEHFLMMKGQWIVNITTIQPHDQLKLDGVIAIPREFIEATILGADLNTQFSFYCSVSGNDMSSDPRCLPWLFSITMNYLDGALACDCHPLGSNSSICEEYGGQCSCKPGVEGRDCSRCIPGFYNLTESGCSPCGCKGPNDVCDVITGECECPENTVGRTCLPCECNNNTDKCLRTGECLECQFNTTGFYCQHCDNGTFGNALIQQCNACACSEIGSLDQECDRVTGQCNCKTKVKGRNCTLCEVNTFNLGPSGCQDCECNTFGSANLQCSSSGQCPCKANATGLKCTQCTSEFYGLPEEPCRECDCNTTGTIPGTVCTNDTVGQCQCKPGVTGRSCDRCMKFFNNFSDRGCEACSECIQNLRRMIVNTSYNVNETNVKVQALKELTDFNEPMVDVSSLLRQAKAEREQFYSRISAGNQVFQDLMNTHVPQTNDSLKELSLMARNLSSYAGEAVTNTTKTLEDITYEKNSTLSARQYVTSVDAIIGDVRRALEEHNTAASEALADSTEAWQITKNRNFSQYSANIHEHIKMAENMSDHVEQTLTRVISKLFRAQELDVSIQEKAANFNLIQKTWNESHAMFMNSIDQVYNHSREIQMILMETKNVLQQELLALNSTKSSLGDTYATLNHTRDALMNGTSIFEQYRSTLSPVNGELEVSMLQYEQERTQFAMRIERGRNLPAKDLSSQTSDPYVLVSTIPDWNNEGTKKSSTVNGDLNPDFPFSDVFRFRIAMEQLNLTQVRLAVYDHDPDGEDDFMGVAFIRLSKVGDFFDNIVTKWYSLIPQDLSEIGSGNFVPSSALGLTDISNLLETELDKIKRKLATAEVKLQQAQNQASYLESLAHQMEQTFNRSRSHGAPAMSAIERYSEISELVNSSLDLAGQANNTMNILYQQLSLFSLDDLQISAEIAWQEFYDLYNGTLVRNLTVQTLERMISDANKTFINSVNLWNEIYEQFPAIRDAAVRFQNVSNKAPVVIPQLMEAQSEVANTSVLLSELEAQLSKMQHVVETLLNKTTFIKESSGDGITMINDAFVNVQNISARLAPNPTEPPVNATVRDAKAVMLSLPQIRHQIETRMDNVSSKLEQIKSMVVSLPFALHLVNNGSVTLVPSRRTIENPLTNEISFDIKTNVNEGLVMYMIGERQTSGRSDWLTNSLAFFISNNTISVVYNLGDGPIVAQNPFVLNNDTWYNVYFTRFGANAFLTVSADSHNRETVMINGSSAAGNTMLEFNNESLIYLGGLPGNLAELQALDYYSGIIDNLVIDNKRFNLWDPAQMHGDTLYAVARYKASFYPANGKAASFFGNGFIQHAPGQFNISSGYTAVEVDFRTLHQNGIIMAVSNEQQRYIFVIYLHNGQVNFYFTTGENDGITLTTSKSSYANGRWYRILVVHTSVNATLAVNPVGSLETPDGRYVETGERVMDIGHVITFGAPDPNRLVKRRKRSIAVSDFKVSEAFSGDMNNLLLFNNTSASLIPRYFNDPAVMIAKQGVSFHGVIRGNIEYGIRFYGYQEEAGDCSYASIDVSNEIAAVSTLTFTFKTKQESGVLLYSKSDIEGEPSLYMALLHGDFLLWLGDIESVAVYSSSNITFSDNSWHVVHLQLSNSGYILYINNTLLYTGIFDFSDTPPILRKPFYIGGIALNKSSGVPYALCFKGGMKNLIIDSSTVSFFSGHTLGVSNAGVIPARVPPPIPPSCSASLLPPTASNSDGTLHFDLQGSRGKGYIGFELNDAQSEVFKLSFVVGLAFRALSDDGIVLYATDNDTHPTQFISVELVQGRILFKFNSGRGLVSVNTKQKYSGNGHWYTVYFLRRFHFGAILVSTNNEYANGKHTPPGLSMKLRRLYVGGLPSHVIAPTLTNRHLGFAGCIKDFNVAGASDSLFDLSKPDMAGSNETRGSCYDTAQPGLGFNGSAWARFDNFSLNEQFNIELTFRTSSRDGVLFQVTGNSTSSAGNRMHVRLEQSSGQLAGTMGCKKTRVIQGHSGGALRYILKQLPQIIILTYNTTINESQVVWTETGLGNNTQSSYLMCQMKWHTVRVAKQGLNITITLDELRSVSSSVKYGANMTGELFLGGYPAKQPGSGHTVSAGFKGCLKKFTLDGNSVHFAQAADLSEVSSACPLTSSEKEAALQNEQ